MPAGEKSPQGLGEFDANKSGETASIVGGTVANILSQLGEGTSLSKCPSMKLLPSGLGLLAMLNKVVNRIVAGQYVDFTEFTPARGRSRVLPSSEEEHIIVRTWQGVES